MPSVIYRNLKFRCNKPGKGTGCVRNMSRFLWGLSTELAIRMSSTKHPLESRRKSTPPWIGWYDRRKQRELISYPEISSKCVEKKNKKACLQTTLTFLDCCRELEFVHLLLYTHSKDVLVQDHLFAHCLCATVTLSPSEKKRHLKRIHRLRCKKVNRKIMFRKRLALKSGMKEKFFLIPQN